MKVLCCITLVFGLAFVIAVAAAAADGDDNEGRKSGNTGLLRYLKGEFSTLGKRLDAIEDSNKKLTEEFKNMMKRRDRWKYHGGGNYRGRHYGRGSNRDGSEKSTNGKSEDDDDGKDETSKSNKESRCRNRFSKCERYADMGFCTRGKKKDKMQRSCPKACKLCEVKKTSAKHEHIKHDRGTEDNGSDDSKRDKDDSKSSVDNDNKSAGDHDDEVKRNYDKKKSSKCLDKSKSKCAKYVKKGYCKSKKSKKMRKYCPRSCNMCKDESGEKESDTELSENSRKDDDGCRDTHHNCPHFVEKGFCANKVKDMKKKCRKSCKLCKDKSGEKENDAELPEKATKDAEAGSHDKTATQEDESKDKSEEKENDTELPEKATKDDVAESGDKTTTKEDESSKDGDSHTSQFNWPKGVRLTVAATKRIFVFNFKTKTWTDHKTSEHPLSLLFYQDRIHWSTLKTVGIFDETFGAKLLFEWKHVVNDVFADTRNRLFYAVEQGKGEILELDLSKRRLLKIQPVSKSIIITNIASVEKDGLTDIKPTQNTTVNRSVHVIGRFVNGSVIEQVVELTGSHPLVSVKLLSFQSLSNATMDNFRNARIFIEDMTLKNQNLTNGKVKDMAKVPGTVNSIHVSKDYIILLGRKEVYLYDRESTNIKTLPKPDLDGEELKTCSLYPFVEQEPDFVLG